MSNKPDATSIDDTNKETSLKEVILSLSKAIRYVISKWMVIGLGCLIGGLLGGLYAYSRKPVYTATTTFVLEAGEGSGGLGQYAGIASMVGIDIGGSNGGGIFQGDNILQLYKSRSMIKKSLLSEVVIDGKPELLINRYITFSDLRKKWADNPTLKNMSFNKDNLKRLTRTQDSLISQFVISINKKNLLVTKPDAKLSIIKVDVTAEDEWFAKEFNDQIVKNVNDFYVQTKTKKSLQNMNILQEKTDSVRRVMNGAIYSAAAVADATPNLNPTRQLQRNAPIQRSQFNAETNKAVLGELVKNLEITKVSLLKETPLIQVVDEPVYPLSKAGISTIKGFILGAMVAGIFTILYLAVRKMIKNIMA
jgi:uncharacterized protein involved in exopolysaccharide biosynthesis